MKTFLLCLLIGGAGVGYVNQTNKIHLLSDQMLKLENQCNKQRRHRQGLLRKLTALNSPNELEAQVRRMNLDLSPTPPDRIVPLPLGSLEVFKKNERLLADQTIQVPLRR
jgi:hypothetical protein